MNSMAYYASGPTPMQPCAPSAVQQIHHSDDIEVHRYDPMPAYNHIPITSAPLYQPAAGSMGFGHPNANMQTFCHSFGGGFSFYNTTGNSGMPQGYHFAVQGFPEAVEARKAIKKEITTPPSMAENAEPEAKKPQQKRRAIACC